jgi:hypothetical protein
MATIGGSNIVTDGLVLALDAANPRSYVSGSSTWNDLSGNNNSGSLVNGPTFSSENGGSIVFDGANDYIECGNPSSLTLIAGTTNLTISGWVNFSVYSGSSGPQNYSVVTNYGNYTTTIWLVENPGNTLRFRVVAGGADVSVSDTSIHLLNTWYYFVGTYDGSNMKIYMNGSLKNTRAQTGTLSAANGTMRIGAYEGGGYCLKGNVALTQVYNRALSASEILQNYNAQKSRYNL